MQSICENEPPSVPNLRKSNLKYGEIKYRGVEQMVARRAHNPEVAGSSPVPATKNESSPMDCFFVFGTMCSASGT